MEKRGGAFINIDEESNCNGYQFYNPNGFIPEQPFTSFSGSFTIYAVIPLYKVSPINSCDYIKITGNYDLINNTITNLKADYDKNIFSGGLGFDYYYKITNSDLGWLPRREENTFRIGFNIIKNNVRKSDYGSGVNYNDYPNSDYPNSSNAVDMSTLIISLPYSGNSQWGHLPVVTSQVDGKYFDITFNTFFPNTEINPGDYDL
ncbi:hypothetical protein [Polaribacter vadi]|uniref:hypothetical protein n=1 Tax=Polaribacter vadi TaxID=1774273 RepID=UPI0030EB77B4